MAQQLRDYQEEALYSMKNGCILCGDTGSGKSFTGLVYYYIRQGGRVAGGYCKSKMINPKDLYIITIAKKRNDGDWEEELENIGITVGNNKYKNNITIDSWNNIKKYENAKDSFFIFDEQRVVGYGSWTKSFLKIARHNEWIMLSATPGDKWEDYIPVFIANGFYENKTQFAREHIVYKRFAKFPQIERYIDTGRLLRLRNRILVDMVFERPTTQHHIDIVCEYDKLAYKKLWKERFDYEKNLPIGSASELCHALRKVCNLSEDRSVKLATKIVECKRVIIFYNFLYELEEIKNVLDSIGYEYSEWNGQKHQPIPNSSSWAYIVQYNAGAEAWNCILTNSIIFYSNNYSYKIMKQSSGRIDRMNTKYKDLYYYHFKTSSPIDISIQRALDNKKKFNEQKFCEF